MVKACGLYLRKPWVNPGHVPMGLLVYGSGNMIPGAVKQPVKTKKNGQIWRIHECAKIKLNPSSI